MCNALNCLQTESKFQRKWIISSKISVITHSHSLTQCLRKSRGHCDQCRCTTCCMQRQHQQQPQQREVMNGLNEIWFDHQTERNHLIQYKSFVFLVITFVWDVNSSLRGVHNNTITFIHKLNSLGIRSQPRLILWLFIANRYEMPTNWKRH